MSKNRGLILFMLVLFVLLTIFLAYQMADAPAEEQAATPYPCPVATPEAFYVEPVTSPTTQLTQVITVSLGLGETITVESEAGTQTVAASYPTLIEVELLPNQTNHLTVSGMVQQVQQGDCVYGGYMLTTTRDRYGAELLIEQISNE